MTDSERLEALIHEIETDVGEITWVTPAIDLYEDYKAWAKRRGMKPAPIDRFALMVTSKQRCLPCRLSDGSIAFFGVRMRDSFN